MTPLRLLIVEDNEDDAELVAHELRRAGFDLSIERVDTEPDMRRALSSTRWDIVISDYSMPEFDAVAALNVLRDQAPLTPFVIVSGTVGEDTAVAAMRMGAQDYLVKGNLKRLVPAIERELRDARLREEQFRAEQALQRSEARFRSLIESLPDPVVVLHEDRIAYVNPQFERLFGLRATDLVGKPFLGLVHPEEHEAARLLMAGVLETESAPPLSEQRWLGPGGAVRHVEVTARPFERDGEPAIVVVARDVTSRRATEEALRASERRFRTLVSSIDDLVYTLDRDGHFRGAYGRWVTREGGNVDRYLGRTPREVFGAQEGKAHEAAFARVLGGSPVVFEWSTEGGAHARHFQTSLSPLLDDAGTVTGAVGVSRETTEQKLVQAQLLVSDRMASVGTLAAGVAHEINNPLAAVLANLDHAVGEVSKLAAAKEGVSPPVNGVLVEVEESLRDASDAASRVHHIVRDLKIFSRGGNEERRSAVGILHVLDSSARMAWNEIRHRARLVKDYSQVPLVEGNEARLGQVFLNLIVNAAQAIPEGRAESNEIKIGVRQVEGAVAVEITDTGHGMSPEVMSRLFTPFFTTKPVGVGTGLGLSICHGIVTGLGGKITIESQVGKGTTCRVILPAATQTSRKPLPATPRPSVPSRRGRVLVVDDEPMIGVAIRRALGSFHEVTVTTRAADALALLVGGEVYDVILCDVMMPELTGMDVYEELKRADPPTLERIIFMTGGAFTARAREFVDAMPNLRIEKPFDTDELRAIVNERMR